MRVGWARTLKIPALNLRSASKYFGSSDAFGISVKYMRKFAIIATFLFAGDSSERVWKIARRWDYERGGADGKARGGRISLVDLRPTSNAASGLAPPQDHPGYFPNTLSERLPKMLSETVVAANRVTTGMVLDFSVGLAEIHQRYWRRPPSRPKPFCSPLFLLA